ncbi:MAG: glucose-6-phosphate isomerase [Bdellovibrionales bacterium]
MSSKAQSRAALQSHADRMADVHIRDLFAADPKRFDSMHCVLDGVLFDYSKHRVTDETLDLLVALARDCDIESARDALFSGEAINTSETRAVLHPALRGSVRDNVCVNDENVSRFVAEILQRIKKISNDIRNNSDITDVISIGIGGSDLGPRMVCEALRDHANGPQVHFLSNIDGHRLARMMRALNPEHTVFIIASKTFTTLETMTNAATLFAWMQRRLSDDGASAHFYAVTENEQAALDFGVPKAHILPLRSWIGGRYSVWSAIGLPIAISCGFKAFEQFLAGAHSADQHFKTAPLRRNIPVLMALLGVWYHNFGDYPAHAVMAYAHDLGHFPAYVQQLDMESNGKSVGRNGDPITEPSGPIVFGGTGTNAQHAFFQHLHQGSQITPVDFIAVKAPAHGLAGHHTQLLANALAQSQALMDGRPAPEAPHRHFAGNRPSSTFILERLDPYHLGLLMALYEHKIFVQGVIWGINSFDQWGVELGKALAGPIADALSDDAASLDSFDSSTCGLIRHLKTQ